MASILSPLTIIFGIVSFFIVSINASLSERIINGNEAAENEFPWQVSIQSIGSQEKIQCSGSIISKIWILTCAQCIKGHNNFSIAVGSIHYNDPQLVIFSDTAVIHPNYKGVLSNDIGLIQLREPLEFSKSITSVQLPNKSHAAVTFEGSKTRISGWGSTSTNSSEEFTDLLWIELTVISNSKCARSYGSIISDSMICAESLKGANICENDYGGGLVIKEDGKWMLIGIASFIQMWNTEIPSVYSRVPAFIDWIKEETGI